MRRRDGWQCPVPTGGPNSEYKLYGVKCEGKRHRTKGTCYSPLASWRDHVAYPIAHAVSSCPSLGAAHSAKHKQRSCLQNVMPPFQRYFISGVARRRCRRRRRRLVCEMPAALRMICRDYYDGHGGARLALGGLLVGRNHESQIILPKSGMDCIS